MDNRDRVDRFAYQLIMSISFKITEIESISLTTGPFLDYSPDYYQYFRSSVTDRGILFSCKGVNCAGLTFSFRTYSAAQ